MPGEADIGTVGGFAELVTGRPAPRAAARAGGAGAARWSGRMAALAVLGWEAAWGLAALSWPDGGLRRPGLLFLALALLEWGRLGLFGAPPGPSPSRQVALAARGLARAGAACLLALLLLGPGPAVPNGIADGMAPGIAPGILADLMRAALALLAARLAALACTHGVLWARLAPRAVLLGAGADVAGLARALAADRGCPYLLGLIDPRGRPDGPAVTGLPWLGGLDRLEEMARDGQVDQVILAGPWAAAERMEGLARRLAGLKVDIRLAPEELAWRFPGAAVTRLGRVSLLHALDRPDTAWAGLAKRGLDLGLGAVLLAAFAAPMLLLALAVRLDSPGPVFFRQRRTGLDNMPFAMWKFRTMHAGRAAGVPGRADGCVQATRGDPRVTRLGAFLRRTSLDELPQLFNVLRGEMSLVGPRPHAPGTPAGGRPFEEAVPFYAGRHRVRPGITGLAQVRGLRGETRDVAAALARVEADYEYIRTWSLQLDLLILLRTAWCVLRMRNAY